MPLFTAMQCLICYKECSKTGNQHAGSVRTLDTNAEICRRFCTLASRYFDLDPFHFAPAKTINSKRAFLYDRACENCVDFLKSFCDIYQQWESLEMRLRWRAHEIAQVMNLADSEGTNRKILEEKLKNMEMEATLEEIDDFRTDFKDTIASIRKTAYPNLIIKEDDKLKQFRNPDETIEDDDFIEVKVKVPRKKRRIRDSEKVGPKNINSPSVPVGIKTTASATSSMVDEQNESGEEGSRSLPVRQQMPFKSKGTIPVSTTQNNLVDKWKHGHESNPGDNPKNECSSSSISDSSQSDENENTVIVFPDTKNTNDSPKYSFDHCQDYLLRNRRASSVNGSNKEDGLTVREEKPLVNDGYLKQFSHLEYICPFPRCGVKFKNMTRMKIHQRASSHHLNAIISILSR